MKTVLPLLLLPCLSAFAQDGRIASTRLAMDVPFFASATSGIAPPGTSNQPPVWSIVRAGCTPDSMAAAKAGSIAATELGRWTCYAQNLTNVNQKVSQISFALDFIELHQLSDVDVADVFATKQQMTKGAKIARGAEIGGLVAGAAMGLSGIDIPARAVAAIGTLTYGARVLGDIATKQIPPSANALAGQWGPADIILLAPGQAIKWKVYASKMKGATQIGPRALTLIP